MHWTYEKVEAEDDLEQGDIIAPTSSLRAILREVHPHFDDDKYLSFMVATQSCDLVRRKRGIVKARYVSIAAVRSLKTILPDLLAGIVRPIVSGVFPKSSRELAKQFLNRLFDQNEQALGLFYLHPADEVGLGDSSVGVLRVKVALKAEHYDQLVEARRGRLNAEFRGKFGWLIGNLYSRAASPDWSDSEGGSERIAELVETHLQEQIPGLGPIWIDDELIEAGRAKRIQFETLTHTELQTKLEELRPKPKMDRLIDAVSGDAKQAFRFEEILQRLSTQINTELECLKEIVGDDQLKELRVRFDAILNDTQQAFDDSALKLRRRLANNGIVKKLVK